MNDNHLGALAKKVRNRSPFSFANINLLGQCNVNCYFCLGFDPERQFEKFQHTGIWFEDWKNWEEFIQRCKTEKIRQIYLTGQNTDSLLYKYLPELSGYLRGRGFYFGLRTNGLLAEKRIGAINTCRTC